MIGDGFVVRSDHFHLRFSYSGLHPEPLLCVAMCVGLWELWVRSEIRTGEWAAHKGEYAKL